MRVHETMPYKNSETSQQKSRKCVFRPFLNRHEKRQEKSDNLKVFFVFGIERPNATVTNYPGFGIVWEVLVMIE